MGLALMALGVPFYLYWKGRSKGSRPERFQKVDSSRTFHFDPMTLFT